jgi:hypothetical protein
MRAGFAVTRSDPWALFDLLVWDYRRIARQPADRFPTLSGRSLNGADDFQKKALTFSASVIDFPYALAPGQILKQRACGFSVNRNVDYSV